MQEITQTIVAVCQELFSVKVEPVLSRPDEQFGDWATNIALQLAKQLGQNPGEVAEQIRQALESKLAGIVSDITIAGPGFINIRLKSEQLANWLHAATEKGQYGTSDVGQGQKVVCEFPSPNMAKPLSVGHLRAATQGWTIYMLMKRLGYEVITDNHLGDYGTPFGKWVVGFLRYSSDGQLQKEGIYELARIYIEITAALKTEKENGDHELADEVQAWLQKLGNGDTEAVVYSQQFNKISLDHLHHVMQRLRIETQYELGESFYVARGQQLADELLEKGVATRSDGAVIVPLEEQGIDTPIMLRKANGTALYATSDLATIEYRQNEWQPKKVFIHTGQEQAFYFRQLKALAVRAGYPDVIEHLWHGLIDQKGDDGVRQKMSSRKGVVLLEQLLDTAEARVREEMKEGSDEDVKIVALGAIKFADFTADRKKGLLFDWDTMFSVQGYSGPAVQYAVVRINSILAKADMTAISDVASYDWEAEHSLLLQALTYPDLLKELGQTYEMHKLAHYLYTLAREFNRYYEATPILKAEPSVLQLRLWFISQLKNILVDGLDILGIPTPERM